MDHTPIDYNYYNSNRKKRFSDISKKGSIQSDQTEFVSMYLNNDDLLDSEMYQQPISQDMIDETVEEGLEPEDEYDFPITRVSRKKSLLSQRRSVQVNLFLENFIKPTYDNESFDSLNKLSSSLTNRVTKKQQNFNLMVIGDSGLGKRTFIDHIRSTYGSNSLINHTNGSTIQEINYNYVMKENDDVVLKPGRKSDEKDESLIFTEEFLNLNVDSRKLLLNVTSVQNYGNLLNHIPIFPIITSYIESKFKKYFDNECSLNRKSYDDERVHACIYFVSPFIQGLKSLDVKFLKSYQSQFNILIVIGRADCLKQSELVNVKNSIMTDLERHGINLNPYLLDYELDEEELYEFGYLCDDLKNRTPFTIVSPSFEKPVVSAMPSTLPRIKKSSSTKSIKETEESEHKSLETVLLSTHFNFFKKLTNRYFYENYRSEYIMDKLILN